MITGIQIICILFGITMLYFTFLHYKKNNFNVRDLTLWIFVWILFIFAASFPSNLIFLLQPLVIQSVIDLLTIGAFVMIFLIIFVLYTTVRKNEQNIKNIVRKIAQD
jgi:hypothetical protein